MKKISVGIGVLEGLFVLACFLWPAQGISREAASHEGRSLASIAKPLTLSAAISACPKWERDPNAFSFANRSDNSSAEVPASAALETQVNEIGRATTQRRIFLGSGS